VTIGDEIRGVLRASAWGRAVGFEEVLLEHFAPDDEHHPAASRLVARAHVADVCPCSVFEVGERHLLLTLGLKDTQLELFGYSDRGDAVGRLQLLLAAVLDGRYTDSINVTAGGELVQARGRFELGDGSSLDFGYTPAPLPTRENADWQRVAYAPYPR